MSVGVVAESDVLEYRRALEALRNGVPNRYAVQALGCSQHEVEDRFTQQLDACQQLFPSGQQPDGLLIGGGFGTGKSHVLEYLRHLALARNFVCSRVVISKETPLHDPGKVFLAAVESAVLPDRRGQAVKEMALAMQKSSGYPAFYQWAGDAESGISPLFPATLLLHERLNNDPELVEDVTNFWSGEKLGVARIRQGLRQCGAATAFTIKAAPAKQLAAERIMFLARMIVGAGYAGWVVLIDEVELVGRYSLLQRGRSYAELARWMGKVEEGVCPGLVSVAAITDDFDISVLQEKGDSEYIGPRLRDKGTEEMAVQAARAETGMRLIRQALHLVPPNEDALNRTYAALRLVHAAAYSWSPPDVEGGGIAMRRAMRSYLRRWINEWDLKRIHPGVELHTEEEDVRPTYGEDDALEMTADPEG